jgi:hypothetical protein
MVLEWYRRHSYSALLLVLMVLFVVHPLLHDVVFGRWLYDVLFTLVTVAAILLFKRRGRRLVALLLGLPTIVATWTGYALPGVPELPLGIAFNVLSAVFLAFVVAATLLTIHEAKAVTGDSLAGAFAGYLLIGATFGHLYWVAEAVTPGAFRMSADLAAEAGDANLRRSLLTYFSFITLTTVGYGDILPVTGSARALACLEAVFGQFYIAVVMAELIGLRVSQPAGGAPSR